MVEHAILTKRLERLGAVISRRPGPRAVWGFREFDEWHAEEVERRGGEEQQSDNDEEVEAVTVYSASR